MKNYINYINETYFYETDGYISLINENEIDNLIATHCKDFSWDDTPIYRGIRNSEHKSIILNPSITERRSSNTKNYYTYIIDNSIEWEDYPDRGRSLICSFGKNIAEQYTDSINGPHRVIPFDGAIFGICPTTDIWTSFKFLSVFKNLDILDEYNELIFEIGNIFDIIFDDSDKTHFFDQLEKLFVELNDIDIEKLDNNISEKYPTRDSIDLAKLKFNILEFPKSLEDLKKQFSPIENGFRLLDYVNLDKLFENPKISKSKAEIWTDSKCLLIPDYVIKKIRRNHEKI